MVEPIIRKRNQRNACKKIIKSEIGVVEIANIFIVHTIHLQSYVFYYKKLGSVRYR